MAALPALTLVLAVVAAACGSSGTPSSSPGTTSASYPPIPSGPITLGVLLALTGPTAAVGTFQKTSYQYYVQQLNARGGIAGHQVNLQVINDQSDPAVAVAGAEQMVNNHDAAILYAGDDLVNQQSIPVFMKAKIPVVTIDPSDIFVDPQKYPYYFSDFPLNTPTMKFMAGFAKNAQHLTKVAVFNDGGTFADQLVPTFVAAARADGLKTITITYSPTATDLTPQVTQAKQEGADGVAILATSGLGPIYDGMNSLGWSVPVLGTLYAYFEGFSSLGPLASKAYSNCAVALQPGQQLDPTISQLYSQFLPNIGGVNRVDASTLINWDVYLIYKYAVEKYHSLDANAVRQAIESIRDKGFSSQEYPYTFTSTNHGGWPYHNIHMCQMTDFGPYDIPFIAPGG